MTRPVELTRASALLVVLLITLPLTGGGSASTVVKPAARCLACGSTAFASGLGVLDGPTGFDADLPDLVVSAPSPDNGLSDPPFCVGQVIDWHTTVTNQGSGEATSTYLGYYVGSAATDYGNRVDSDAIGALAPNGGSSAEHEVYAFSAADAGMRYTNVWADYADDLPEEDENNNQSSYGPFEVVALPAPPVPLAPPNDAGTCDTAPAFSWSSVAGATSYRIQVDGRPDFSSPDIDATSSGTSYAPAMGLGAGTFYWRVRASNTCGDGAWSATWSFTVLSSPGTPGLISPSDGSVVDVEDPTFVWGSVTWASAYRIQVAEDSDVTLLVIDETTSGTTFGPGGALADDTTYYWRVAASNECGSGPWSSVWQFTVDAGCPTPPAPVLSSPTDGSNTCDGTPTLRWEGASGATSYRVQVDGDPGMGSPVINTTTSATIHTPGTALPADTYYWRVQPSNACGDGPWSSVWHFTVVAAPGNPGLATPPNGSVVTDDTPAFSWSSVNGATNYRIQVSDNVSFSSPLVDDATSDTVFVPGDGLADGTTYYWRVLASNACGNSSWSTVWHFTVDTDCPVPAQPALTSPANGSGTCESKPEFYWSAVTGATSYRVQVDDAAGFSSPAINEVTASPSYNTSTPLPPGGYFWRAQSSNACGAGPWSIAWHFSILSAPATPSLLWPPDGGSSDDPTPLLEWSLVSEASLYRLQVDNHASFSSPEIDQSTSGTWHAPETELAPDTYHWRVQSSNACGVGPWTLPAWSFTITAEPDTSPPAAITDLKAVTGTSAGSTDLSWTAPGDDGDIGRAASYVVRYNTTLITEGVWAASADVPGAPLPSPAGSQDELTVLGLAPGQRYFFAIKTQDEVPNSSGISNSPHAFSASQYQLYLPVMYQMGGVWDSAPSGSAE